jgi:hypothetical protein
MSIYVLLVESVYYMIFIVLRLGCISEDQFSYIKSLHKGEERICLHLHMYPEIKLPIWFTLLLIEE